MGSVGSRVLGRRGLGSAHVEFGLGANNRLISCALASADAGSVEGNEVSFFE
jgi:hypothetical protein